MAAEFARPHRRAGAALMAIGITGFVVAALAGVLGWRLIGEMATSVETSLTLGEEALVAIDDTIHVARSAVETVSEGVGTVDDSLGNASATLGDIGGLFDEVRSIASEELPNSIASVRRALPPLIESGALLTETLEAISRFGIGVAPVEPIESPLRAIDSELLELEERMRSQADALSGVTTDFDDFARTATQLQESMAAIDADLDRAVAVLASYDTTAGQAEQAVAATRSQVERGASTARALVVALTVLFGLAQLAPIYLGYLARRPVEPNRQPEYVVAGVRR